MDNSGVNVIIDELYEMIQEARSVPLSVDKCIVERDRVLDILDELISALPEDIKKARTIVDSRNELVNQARKEAETTITQAKEQSMITITSANGDAERIKANAKAEADNIIAKAKAQAQELVSKEAVYKETERQCKDMVDKANSQIAELKAVSFKYMSDSLKKTAETIEASLKDVNMTREKFDSMTGEKKPKPSYGRNGGLINIDID